MFKITIKPLKTNDWKIVTNYEELYFYEIPMLFTGFNKKNQRIMASSVYEDFENKIERFFYIIISEPLFEKFLQQKITLLQILQNNQPFFVVDEAFDRSKSTVYNVNHNDIPPKYLPLEDSYYPYKQEVKKKNAA